MSVKITASAIIGYYKASRYTPAEVVGTKYVKFCGKEHEIFHVKDDIVQLHGNKWGRIIKTWNKRVDDRGITRVEVEIVNISDPYSGVIIR